MVGATLSPTTWFPFGGGNRRCLGAGFAMVEMRVVLREILRRVELGTTTQPASAQKLKFVVLVPQSRRSNPRARRSETSQPRRPQPPRRRRRDSYMP